MNFPLEKSRIRFPALGLAVALVATAACDDDPVAPADDHAEPEGVHVLVDGRAVATYDGDDRTWTGRLDIGLGEGNSEITVRFVDHDGDPVPIDDDLYLDVVVADEEIADFHPDAPGAFMGHFDGVATGETSAVFRLMHGAVGSGHADFETTPVQVRVAGPV